MNLKDARTLRDEIRAYGYHCTVPLGYGPDGYSAFIFGAGPIEFKTRAAFRKHHAIRLRHRRQTDREIEKAGGLDAIIRRAQGRRDTRSPIDRMIDEACDRG